ncbi:MAG: tyrosine-type recombinase/integrase [Chitinophagaceae bacterium]
MNKFSSFLAPIILEYISYQKVSEHWNTSSYEANLLLFDRYCLREYPEANRLSQNIADRWCHKRDTEENNSCRSRIYVIISFIQYLKKRGKTDITTPAIPRKEPRTYLPHAFTEMELQNFFYACDSISGTVTPEQRTRRITIPVFFRLLYSSGIRTTEARMLRVEDVNLCNGTLNIRYSKGHDQHFIVLHDTMLELMKKYDTAIREMHPGRTYFFPSRGDKYHTRHWVQKNFRELWYVNNPSYATAYELRHHYAIENINRWTGYGMEFHAKFLYLSKSMGHSVLESTKYYYSLVPGFGDIIAEKTMESFNIIVPEVQQNEEIN